MPLTVAVVELEYCCRACGGPVAAKIRLEGELEGPEGPFCVFQGLTCPDPECACINDVIFDTEGEVRLVTARVFPTPNWN